MTCFECGKYKCYYKIVCYSQPWEFAACGDHINALEKKADRELGKRNGVMRTHVSSTSPVKRELMKEAT